MPDSTLDLTVEKPAAGGRMIARHDGQIVLVSGAIPGERVRARVERVSKGVIYATATDVLDASADRRPVTGDWLCGGNVYAHVAYERQLKIKAAVIGDAFTRIGRMPLGGEVHVTGAEELGYRMRARFHMRNGRMGFFREGTHDLCDPRQTGQLLPQTADAVEALASALIRSRVRGVSSAELSENMAGDERALHLEIDSPEDLSAVGDSVGEAGITGLSYSGPFSGIASSVCGSPQVKDRVLVATTSGEHAFTLRRNVRSFFQGNRYLLPTLVSRVVSLTEPGPVVDLYAGVGLFSVALVASGRTAVVAVEGDKASANDLKANAAEYSTAIDARHQSVESFLSGISGGGVANNLIVDPPRTGMSREALDGIVSFGAPTVLYVSCDVATLARDVRRLVDAGYVLEHIEGFDLFPNTAHVEAIVKLRRA